MIEKLRLAAHAFADFMHDMTDAALRVLWP